MQSSIDVIYNQSSYEKETYVKDTKIQSCDYIILYISFCLKIIIFSDSIFIFLTSSFKENAKLQVFTFAFVKKLRNYPYFPFIYITFTPHLYFEYY